VDREAIPTEWKDGLPEFSDHVKNPYKPVPWEIKEKELTVPP